MRLGYTPARLYVREMEEIYINAREIMRNEND
jgi:hypothetical protein